MSAAVTGLHQVKHAPPPPPPPGPPPGPPRFPPPKPRKAKTKPKWASKLDMYAKVPGDMLEGTKSGSYLSIVCVSVLLALIFMETKSFLYSGTIKSLSLDSNKDSRVRVNFNITMMDLKCAHATVDVVSFLGTNQNVTQHITKQSVTAEGVRKRYAGRNVQQHDIVLKDDAVVETIDELHENGEDAISLDETTLDFARREYDFLFVDFFASWCSHCQVLAPTWEVLAEVMSSAARTSVDAEIEGREHEYSKEDYDAAVKLAMPAMIAKVDCVVHKDLCMKQMIRGYPTLRLFIHGGAVNPPVPDKQTVEYNGPRTVLEMTNWLAAREEEHKNDDAQIKLDDAHEIARDRLGGDSRDEMNSPPERPFAPKSKEEEEWVQNMARYRSRQRGEWHDEDHPGCQISGFLLVDRVPGDFHLQARSPKHDFEAHMINVSHEVHHLSFGSPGVENEIKYGHTLAPPGFLARLSPMDGNVYVTRNEHEAYHHYLKIISTDVGSAGWHISLKTPEQRRAYQILQSSQLSFYHTDQVPEAKFSYDLSPIAVAYEPEPRRWYDYVTSIMVSNNMRLALQATNDFA